MENNLNWTKNFIFIWVAFALICNLAYFLLTKEEPIWVDDIFFMLFLHWTWSMQVREVDNAKRELDSSKDK